MCYHGLAYYRLAILHVQATEVPGRVREVGLERVLDELRAFFAGGSPRQQ